MSFPLKLSHLKSDHLFVHVRNKLVAEDITKASLIRKIVFVFINAKVQITEFTRAIALVLVDEFFLLDIENTWMWVVTGTNYTAS